MDYIHGRGKRKKQLNYCSQELQVLVKIWNVHLKGLGLSLIHYILKSKTPNKFMPF